MQKIKDFFGKIKKSLKKLTKKQKNIAYIVLGALIVGITVPAVYLNKGSLFKGQLGEGAGVTIGTLKGNSVQHNYYGALGDFSLPAGVNVGMQCSGTPAGTRNLDDSIDVTWTANGILSPFGVPLQDIQEHYKVLYYGWSAPGANSNNNDGTGHIVDVGAVRSLLTQPNGPYKDQADGWASYPGGGGGTIVAQSIGGKVIKVTYPKDSTTVTATLSGGIIYSDNSFDIKGFSYVTPATGYNSQATCSLNLELPPTPPKVTATGKVQKDGYTVLWENTTDTSGSFSVKEYVWVDADGKKISTNHTKTYSQSNPDGTKTASIAPKIVFNYDGTTFKDYFQKNPDKLSVVASYIEVPLTGSATALAKAQAANKIASTNAAEIVTELAKAQAAAKKAQAALAIIKNGPAVIGAIVKAPVLGPGGRVQTPSNQLTDAQIQAQIDIAKAASDEVASMYGVHLSLAIINGPQTKIDNSSKDPAIIKLYDATEKLKTAANANATLAYAAAKLAKDSYASALTEGKAKFASNASKDQAAKDLAAAKLKQAADDLAAQKAAADAALAAQQADADAKLAAQKTASDAALAAQQAANDAAAKQAADAAAKQVADQAAQQAADAAAKQASDQAAQKAAADAAAQQAADQAAKQAAADAAAKQNPPQTSQLTKTLPTDISGHWAESIITQAVNKGVVVIGPNGLFNPNQPITRADVAVMAMRALAQTPTPCTNVQCGTPFNDNVGDLITAGYIAKANSLGIIVNAQNFRPYATLTRAEAASILAKMIKYKDPTFHLRTPAECYYHATWHWSCGTGAPNNIATDINADWEGQYFRSLWDYNPTIFQGKAPHIFAPEDQITNAEMLKIIMNAVKP